MRLIPPTVLVAALLWPCGARATTPSASDESAATTPPKKDPPGELAAIVPPRKDRPRLELHGGAYFWYYQPLSITADASPDDGNLELYLASLDFEGRLDDFGIVLHPRFRDSEAREFFTSNVWIEEAYAYYEHPYITAKAGKVYSRFSPLSDGTFYGSVPYFDGLKLDSNYGLSLEGSFETEGGVGFGYSGQYFLLDGGTNGSLRHRDTVWVDNTLVCDPNAAAGGGAACDPDGDSVHRNHTVVFRLDPSYRFNQKASLRFGAAFQHTYVNFTEATGLEPDNVFRVGGDVSLVYGPVRAFAEFVAQFGKTVTNYPITPIPATMTTPAVAGRSSGHNHYVLAGAEAQLWRFTARYSFSHVNYRDLDVTEWLHLPGVALAVHDNVAVMLEYAYWRRTDPGRSSTLDNSLNGVVHARF
jgi:hypothetical protein